MISRLTLAAALFSVLATATLTFAAESHQQQLRAEPARSSAAVATPHEIIVLPRVEIIGRRTH